MGRRQKSRAGDSNFGAGGSRGGESRLQQRRMQTATAIGGIGGSIGEIGHAFADVKDSRGGRPTTRATKKKRPSGLLGPPANVAPEALALRFGYAPTHRIGVEEGFEALR